MSKIHLIDTNVILRLLVGDDSTQEKLAKDFFKQLESAANRSIISIQVISEVIWIADRYYELEKTQFIPQIRRLIASPKIEILEMNKPILLELLHEYMTSKLDFTDLYLAFSCRIGEFGLVTFDKKLAKRCQVKTLDSR